MWRVLATIVSVIVLVAGVVLRFSWFMLDVIGRIFTMLDSPDRFVHFIDWLAAHPSLALDLGPWILITASILSLVGIHAPSFRRICAKLRQPADKKENIGRAVPSSQTAINLPIGSLRYVIATMNLEIKEDLSRVSGRIEVELHNDSDFLIMFHATTAGRINGVPFDHNKVEFDGYADPKQSIYLVSNRLASIPLPDGLDLNNPSMDGVYEYELQYKEATEDRFSRRTAKGIHIQQWLPIPSKPAGTQVVIPVRVILRDEIEE